MLRSVYLKTLRDLRWGILGWGVGLGALLLVTAAGWSIAYPDQASRAQLAAQIEGGLSAAQVLYGPPRNIETLGGFLEWRSLGLAPVLVGIYMILSATGITRGAEESGTIEVVAATPATRTRMLIEQAAALVTALIMITTMLGVLTLFSGAVAGEATPNLLGVAGAMANLAAAALLFASLGLLAAQLFERRRAAALAASVAMIFFYFANTLPLAAPGLYWLQYVSPFHLYSRSAPLATSHMDWAAFGGLILAAVAVAAAALFAARQRDLFDTYHPRRRPIPISPIAADHARTGPASSRLFLRSSLGRGVRDASLTIVVWAGGLSALAVVMTALAPHMREALLARPGGIFFGTLVTERTLLSALLFSVLMPPLVALVAVTLAAAWAGDELGQRLELELTTPLPRWQAFLQRLGAAIVSVALVITIAAAAVAFTIEVAGVDVPVASVAATSGALLAMTACVVAVSFFVASWRPDLTAALAGAFVAVSFFADLVLPLLGLPFWVRYFTVFGLYGSPLAHGVSSWRIGVLASAALAFALAGAAQFQRRDIFG